MKKYPVLESVLISAKTGEGCDELESSLYKKATLGGLPQEDEIWITNRRQQQAQKMLCLLCSQLEKV